MADARLAGAVSARATSSPASTASSASSARAAWASSSPRTHLELDQRVAIKFLLPEAVDRRGSRRALPARGARRGRSIKSEHVARVIDVGDARRTARRTW